ncbi:MAG: YceI family protein [Deltaproteobacteria bacterium]|nr:YceI family protein [Deltaproteobacteria bacterium]
MAVLSLLCFGMFIGNPCSLARAQERTFRVIAGSSIQFISNAPLERMTGSSRTVEGEFVLNPSDLSQIRGTIRVPIATLRTGIELRDEHLRGPSELDAARYPHAVFEPVRVEGARNLVPNQVVRFVLVDRFSLHGVTRELRAEVQVRWMPASDELRSQGISGDLIRAQATFVVNLPDYGIYVNPFVRLKVSDNIRVNVTLRAASG